MKNQNTFIYSYTSDDIAHQVTYHSKIYLRVIAKILANWFFIVNNFSIEDPNKVFIALTDHGTVVSPYSKERYNHCEY